MEEINIIGKPPFVTLEKAEFECMLKEAELKGYAEGMKDPPKINVGAVSDLLDSVSRILKTHK